MRSALSGKSSHFGRWLRRAFLLCIVLGLASCGGGDSQGSGSNQAMQAGIIDVPAPSVIVTGITKVSETRVSRTVYDYVFQVTFKNNSSGPQSGLAATLTGAGTGTTIIKGSVRVGDLAAGASVTPQDTITLRQDRTFPFNLTALVWNINVSWVINPSSNSVPVILSEPPTAALVGKSLQHQIVVLSSDPKALQYSLSTAPTGMSLDAATGLLTWTPGTNQAGDQSVTIVAKDSVGQTSQSFTLSVFGMRQVASVLITASNGGVITVNDSASSINGLTISIPPKAIASDKTISVSELISPPTLGGTHRFLMKGFTVDPDGTALAIPATVTVPYSVSEFDTSEGVPLEDFLGVYFVETSTGTLEFSKSLTVDTTNHVVTGTVPHFSSWVIANIARLCPPPTPSTDCPNPNTLSSLTPSNQLPAITVHGFQNPLPLSPGLGNETTWGQLRYLLGQVDSANCTAASPPPTCGRIDAWRFDWDSVSVPFESSAHNLASAIFYVTHFQNPSVPPPANILAHSFGGILVRCYLESNATLPLHYCNQTSYRGDVSEVMTLGTPHAGIGGGLSTSLVNNFEGAALSKAIAAAQNAILTGTPLGDSVLASGSPALYQMDTGNPVPPSVASFLSPPPGAFLQDLNNNIIPSDVTFVHIRGHLLEAGLPLTPYQDDGLITDLGDLFICQNMQSACTSNVTVRDYFSPLHNNFGLCHSYSLFGVPRPIGCDSLQLFNYPMVYISDKTNPMWEQICKFLSNDATLCPPTLRVTLSDPEGGTVTSSSAPTSMVGPVQAEISCPTTCSETFPPVLSATTTTPTPPQNGVFTAQTVTLTATANTAAGYTFSGWSGDCKSDGTIAMTKDQSCTANFSKQAHPLPISISAGDFQTCALLSDGTVQCWGQGPLGDGTSNSSSIPVTVGISGASSISVRGGTSCAISGGVACWGTSIFSEKIDKLYNTDLLTPTLIPGFGGTKDIAIMSGLCELDSSNSADCTWFGGNPNLVSNNPPLTTIPLPVPGITDATAIAGDNQNVCAIVSTGRVKCWGVSLYGDIWSPMDVYIPIFDNITNKWIDILLTGAKAISVGRQMACAILEDDSVSCWYVLNPSQPAHNFLALPVYNDYFGQPQIIIGPVVSVAVGDSVGCATLTNGGVECWGLDWVSGTNAQVVDGITGAIAAAVGYQHVCALLAGGAVKCWGDNSVGQLGDGTTTSSSTPVSVFGFP